MAECTFGVGLQNHHGNLVLSTSCCKQIVGFLWLSSFKALFFKFGFNITWRNMSIKITDWDVWLVNFGWAFFMLLSLKAWLEYFNLPPSLFKSSHPFLSIYGDRLETQWAVWASLKFQKWKQKHLNTVCKDQTERRSRESCESAGTAFTCAFPYPSVNSFNFSVHSCSTSPPF